MFDKYLNWPNNTVYAQAMECTDWNPLSLPTSTPEQQNFFKNSTVMGMESALLKIYHPLLSPTILKMP
jgi:hypothetical protein